MTERTQHGTPNQVQQQAAPPAAGSLLLPDPHRAFAEQAPQTLLAMCLFGEARGESDAARRAVAQVAVNRAKFPHAVFGSRSGADFFENLRLVILQPEQFSCFSADDPNSAKLLRPLDCDSAGVWRSCMETAQEALAARDQQDGVTRNSDHYFDRSIQAPPWADPSRQTVQIGRLRFFRLYLPPSEAVADVPPSRRESTPPEISRRARRSSRSLNAEGSSAALRQEDSGSGPRMSFPAPHHPSQRSPRLGLNRWFQRSRELTSLPPGLAAIDASLAGLRRAALGMARAIGELRMKRSLPVARNAALLAALCILLPAAARAQQYELGLSGNFYLSTLPHSAANLDILIGSGATWSYNTIELRPIGVNSVVISARTGVEHTLYSSGRVQLNADANVGVSTSTSDTALGAAGGGNLMIQLTKSEPVYLTIGGELSASAALPGTYQGQAKIGLRWALTPPAQ